jgi:hypothetical protein
MKNNYFIIVGDYLQRFFDDKNIKKTVKSLNECYELNIIGGHCNDKDIVLNKNKKFKQIQKDINNFMKNEYSKKSLEYNDELTIDYVIIEDSGFCKYNDFETEVLKEICAPYGVAYAEIFKLNDNTHIHVCVYNAESG